MKSPMSYFASVENLMHSLNIFPQFKAISLLSYLVGKDNNKSHNIILFKVTNNIGLNGKW